MKKIIVLIAAILLCSQDAYAAETFLEVPLPPGSETKTETDSRLEFKAPFTHDEARKFYREALEGKKNIKFRDWKDATYIEDDDARPWHSITISKMGDERATIVIMKDNWTWIIGTLILRYIGVFVVLLVLFVGMSVSGAIISRSVKNGEAKKT